MSNNNEKAVFVDEYKFAALQRRKRQRREPFYALNDHEYAMTLERWGITCIETSESKSESRRLDEEALWRDDPDAYMDSIEREEGSDCWW